MLRLDMPLSPRGPQTDPIALIQRELAR